jgi:thiol-disulfide isomerase/thioredoxin
MTAPTDEHEVTLPAAAPGAPRSPSSPRRPLFVWGERIVTAALLVFVLYRLGPQLGALTGIGPDLGRAPVYEFTALDGTPVRSRELVGQVVVLNFWATWCGPCKLEMPALQSLHEDLASEGVTVLGLSTDVGSGAAVPDFLEERSISYPVGRATDGHRLAFGGIPGIPTTFIIDRSGIIRHRVVGYFAPPAMRAAVHRLLAASSLDGLSAETAFDP